MTAGASPARAARRRAREWLQRLENAWLRLTARRPSPAAEPRFRVLVVCRGNYCRSPVAEGVLRARLAAAGLADAVAVESAGTSAYYAGRAPHRHARAVARRRGIDIRNVRARSVDSVDLAAYDLVVAVDERTRAELLRRGGARDAVVLLGDYAGGGDVEDPIGGERDVFERTHAHIEEAGRGLARAIAKRLDADR